MKTRRLLAAAALVCTALTLTACGPDETTGAAASPTAAPGTPSSPPAASGKPAAPATPSGVKTSAKPTAAKPSGPAPTADCTANAANLGKVVEPTEVGFATHVWMKAKDTKFICGPDVPNDGYFESFGAAKLYTFSNDVKAYVLENIKPTSVSLNDFMNHADTCLKSPNTVQQPRSCYGQYMITADSSNVITKIEERYRP